MLPIFRFLKRLQESLIQLQNTQNENKLSDTNSSSSGETEKLIAKAENETSQELLEEIKKSTLAIQSDNETSVQTLVVSQKSSQEQNNS